ncbi:helix-turn-helix domain-containing protein [Streptomyces huiliensis]|uniref:helix-turn-helix domain-containing protein n=1 Tax=Streptomyces huiliensis TaxID=2876027 RepID=UPI0027E032D5|nr:helix-turn-helix transcriptional regulator [Streptomyces huiliensis]MBZ4318772.1 helix-turn-helix transcriptional regulator [Streptomyces huiliensis]
MLDRSPGEPLSPARQFGEEVKAAREARGWSQEQLAAALHCGQPYVSKVERGEQLASAAFAAQCDRVFGTPGTYARMRRRAADAGYPMWFIPFVQLEREARAVCDYSRVFVLGILQTREYAEAIFRAAHPEETDAEIAARVEERLRRREVFDGPQPPSMWVILHESVLWSNVGGPDVMRAQLEYLLVAAESPHITLQIFPATGPTPARGSSFSLFIRQDKTDVLYEETYTQGQTNEVAQIVAEARSAFDRLRADALPLDDSLTLIRNVMEAYAHEHPLRLVARYMDEVQLLRGKQRPMRRIRPKPRTVLRHRPRPRQ